jgi:hypothetical protein
MSDILFVLVKKIPLFYAQHEVDPNEARREQSKMTDVLLDPNHTHFILVDDGSEGLFGKEIEFRAHLEAELRKGKSLKYYESKRNVRKKISARSNNSASSNLSGAATTTTTLNNANNNNNQQQISDDENDSQDEDGTRNESVPMILIVVQGGPNTLITVEESLKQAVPVLILAVSNNQHKTKGCSMMI